MTEREVGAENITWLPEQLLELVSVFQKAKQNFKYIFLLNKAGLKI
jgi:hypothetical protein